MPRVSRPEAPASERNDGVRAVRRIGSSSAPTIWPMTMLVSDTSAVGISQRPSVVWNRSSANLGSLSVP